MRSYAITGICCKVDKRVEKYQEYVFDQSITLAMKNVNHILCKLHSYICYVHKRDMRDSGRKGYSYKQYLCTRHVL